MELAQLEHFVTLADHLHFRRAATVAGISASTLSRQIVDLEADLDVRLFDRNRRQVSLTPAGKVFLVEAQAILHHVRHAAIDARRVARGERERLRIGHGDAVGLVLLQGALPKLRAEFPELRLELIEAPSEQLLDGLVSRSVDVALVRPPVHHADIDDELLCDEDLVVTLPAGHRLAERRKVSVADLTGESLVVPPRGQAPGAYDRIMALFAGVEDLPDVTEEGTTAASLLLLVAAGLGIGISPVCSTHHFDPGGIVVCQFSGRMPTMGLHAAWRAGEDHSSVLALRAALEGVAAERAGMDGSGVSIPHLAP